MVRRIDRIYRICEADVIDISSVSPLAAKRAAGILLQTPYYAKFDEGPSNDTLDDNGRRFIRRATALQ
jgi:hypothetical protein